MNRKKNVFSIIFMLVLYLSAAVSLPEDGDFSGTTVVINSSDGLKINADIYLTGDNNDPVLLLFHQAGFSRGEYRETAPILNEMGFNCIAIDQRSGKGVNGISNEAYLDASAKGLGVNYTDAFPDLEAALKTAIKKFPDSKIIVWGSSYSASLVFVLAQKYPDKIAAVIAFSPGEYFKFTGKQIAEYAEEVKCPVFITSAKKEYGYWKTIYEAVPEGKKSFFLPESEGVHGSRALWRSNPDNCDYWAALQSFFSRIER